MKKIISIILMTLVIINLSSCFWGLNSAYKTISAEEAKEIMDTEFGYIILDVRSEIKYNKGHIEGAILIPEHEIAEKAESILQDKNQLILVYCDNGSKSKRAASTLADLGYINVMDFGGISDWPYGVVTE